MHYRIRSVPSGYALPAVLTYWAILGSWPVCDATAVTAAESQRPAWSTSRVSGSPEPPLPYITERAFPALKFNQCLDLVAAPGTDRLFVVEQGGKIFSFPNRPDVQQADLVLDFTKAIPGTREVYSLAFHPQFERNRYCYVCYIQKPELPDGTHIARFKLNDTDPPTIDASSEATILTFLCGGHNGCCLKFGPDGFLYISTGDGTGPNPPDILKTGQDVSDLLSSILRVDVDHPEGGKNYRLPPDNPLLTTPGARGEIWAYGLRNPWRMSFDRKTGDFWVGDVGWEMWEMLYRVEPGGNYGWAVTEGRQATNPEWPRGPTPILPPTIDHPHTESSSITEGLTYYGSRLPDLDGCHLYGDYDTGKIWAFRYREGRVTDHREVADTTHRIVSFGEDLAGEFYLLDHTAGTLHRMIPNPKHGQTSQFPRRLSDSGLFASVPEQKPAPGVIPYWINAEPWADHATSERWIAIPGDASIKTDSATWTYPVDTVLVKTLSLEMRPGDRSSIKRLETQLLHYDGVEWMPYTYRWNDEQTDAELVAASGAERTLEVADSQAPGGTRRQAWRYSGRAECQRCHNKWSGPPLGFQTVQLNRPLNRASDRNGAAEQQLDHLAALKLFSSAIADAKRPKIADPRDPSAEVSARARAYLHANCSHCHRMHAGGAVLSQMHYDVELEKSNMIGVRPTQGTFGIHSAAVIAPGDPYRSVLLYRVSKLGGGRMPHIGSTEVDVEGVRLIHDWVRTLPASVEHSTAAIAKRRDEEAAKLSDLTKADTVDKQDALVDHLLASTSGSLRLLHAIDQRTLSEALASRLVERVSKHEDPTVRDLFERFVPAEKRVQRLGAAIQADQILAIAGDAARGRKVFFETNGVACKNCHRIGKEGKEVGPELTAIGKKYTRAQILENILEPSKIIEPKFVTYLVETDDGRLLTGLLVKKDEREVSIKDATDKVHTIPAANVEQFVPQRQSLMPESQLRDLTAQQVADLLEFLGSLKDHPM